MNPIHILDHAEQQDFDSPPTLSHRERVYYFETNPEIDSYISRLSGHTHKIGFLLQLGYFRKMGKFFSPQEFIETDIRFVSKLLDGRFDAKRYTRQTQSVHRHKIRQLLEWSALDGIRTQQLKQFIKDQVTLAFPPQKTLEASIIFCWNQRIEIPSYRQLSQLITRAYRSQEVKQQNQLKKVLTRTMQRQLDKLLQPSAEDKHKPLARPKITQLKKSNQSLKPKAIKENVATFAELKSYLHTYQPSLDKLSLPDSSIRYYAHWVRKATTQQLRSFFNPFKRYFYLLMYLVDEAYHRHDTLMDIFLRAIQSAQSKAKRLAAHQKLENAPRQQLTTQAILKDDKRANATIDAIEQVLGQTALNEAAKLDAIDNHIQAFRDKQDNAIKSKQSELNQSFQRDRKEQDYFEALEQQSLKLQHRVNALFLQLEFDQQYSDPTLLEAVTYYQRVEGQVDHRAPLDFLDAKAKQAIRSKKDGFPTSLYKALFFIAMADGVKAGKLNLSHSYRYRPIQSYLIGEQRWEVDQAALLAAANLTEFQDGEKVLGEVKQCLNDNYSAINTSYSAGENPYLSINPQGKLHIRTPKVDKDNESPFISTLLEQHGFVPILQVLNEVDAATQFTQAFRHSSQKHVKMKRLPALVKAAVIGLGCNIGIGRMGNISAGISADRLNNLVNWCFSVENIHAANQRIVDKMNQLALPSIYQYHDAGLHTSSDGRKVGVNVESLAATYSFKYF